MQRICWQIAVILAFAWGCTNAGNYLPPSAPTIRPLLHKDDEWYRSDEGKRLVSNIISWQNENGGWWKTYDPKVARPAELPPPNPDSGHSGDKENDWRRTSTFDNDATTTELRILAHAARITGSDEARQAFERGMKFIFDSQYSNGGWPQRFPLENNYGRHITFNDGLMTNILTLLREAAQGKQDFAFIPDAERKRAQEAFDRGINCVLKCQIRVNEKLTAWCQQHDAQTLGPTGGRAYELPSISGSESADVVLLLMDLENPAPRMREAIEGAADWYKRSEIFGKRFQRVTGEQYENGVDRIMVDDPNAPPLWARFYEIETNRPFLCNRDGVKVYSLAEVAHERRLGYAWYGTWGAKVLSAYPKWKQRVKERGDSSSQPIIRTVQLADAREIVVASDGSGAFKTVQQAVDSIERDNSRGRAIVIRPGIYRKRVTVPKDKPGIRFKGEGNDPSKTVLTFDLNANMTLPGTTQPVGTSGTPSISIEADDFAADNLTFENSAGDKGQAVALKVTGDRCIFRNCRLLGWQDTLYIDNGRQYFKDCYIEGRVDFIFGGSTTVFDHCTIHSKNGGYVTAARTSPDRDYGFVFLDCTLTGEGDAKAYLGRPWQWDRGRKAAVAFIRTKMGPHIRPEGWNPWDRPNNPNAEPQNTTRYSEFASVDDQGRPLDVSQRVTWSHQLSANEAARYTLENILGWEDHWNPARP